MTAQVGRRAVIYDRTSGDEHEDQNAAAQLAQTVHRAREQGFEVVSEFSDPDVSGDTPWDERKGLKRALAAVRGHGATLVVREITRLWRGDPVEGLRLVAAIPDLYVLDAPDYARVSTEEAPGGAWVNDSDSAYLTRFIGFWSSWAEKRRAIVRSALAMADIKEGRRKTRSGRPPHRPQVVIEAAHMQAAREVYAETGRVTDAWRRVLELRGWRATADARTNKPRYVSKAKVGELLGLYNVRKSNASESQKGEARADPDDSEPLPDKGA